jgi:hypothetical protein
MKHLEYGLTNAQWMIGLQPGEDTELERVSEALAQELDETKVYLTGLDARRPDATDARDRAVERTKAAAARLVAEALSTRPDSSQELHVALQLNLLAAADAADRLARQHGRRR